MAECEFCHYKTVTDEYSNAGKSAQLCEVCASTMAGNAYFYPNPHVDADVLRMIAYTTNMILDALQGRQAMR